MPGGDRTGPDGRGRLTGRGLGYCAGYESPGFMRGPPMGIPPEETDPTYWPIGFRGRGFGRGRGRGRRGRFW